MDSYNALFFAAPTERIDVGASQIAYRRFGSGPPLVLVHGFPLSGYTWRKILPALAAKHTCYVPDLPGMGDSEWSDQTDFSFPGQGATLKAFVDGLGVERYSVLAQDTGGTFARYLAFSDVDRVDKLILINTEIPNHRPPWIPFYQFLMSIPGATIPFKWLLHSRLFRRSGMGFGGCFNDTSLIEGEFYEHVVAPLFGSKKKMEGLRRYLTGAKWPPVDALEKDHARLTMPTRLIWGVDDPTFPIDLARQMVSQFPNADLVEISGASLLVYEEKPTDVAEAVIKFLK
jgi:pimeloyl-ACP methyl ester carboxylesterase